VKEYPYWWDTVGHKSPEPGTNNPEPGTQNPSVVPSRADVAIVGGGYTGLAAARHLARAGASVVVLERDRVGSGASSRNGGQVLTGMRLDPATLVARFGERRARQLFEISLDAIASLETLIAEEAIACDYERTGHLQAAWKPSHFRAFRDEQALLSRVFGHRVDLVSRANQRSELGSDLYHGLSIDERSAALHPAKYVAGLAGAAQRAGAALVEHTPVVRVTRASGGRSEKRWAVATAHGDVEAGDVLIATNGYTDSSSPLMQRRLVPIGSYIIGTAPLPAADAAALLPKRRVAFDSKHFLFYWRVTGDRRLLFGGRAEFTPPTPESTRRAASILRDGLAHVFPQLAAVGIDYAWGGNVAFTRDQLPHAGRLDDDVYYAGGYSGHGIAMATALGTLIARRIAGEPIDHPLMDDRFPAIPFYNGRPWFLPLVGAYYKLRDALA
jgi:glycine/D-amino acid oxidase-like deaminating enzyme